MEGADGQITDVGDRRLQAGRQRPSVEEPNPLGRGTGKKTALAAGPWRKSAPCRNPRPSCRDPAGGNPLASEGPITFKQDRRNHFATAEFRTEATGTPDMTEFDTGQGKSVANAVRQLLRSEDYRRHLHGVLNLAVDPRLPSTFVPLLEALDQAGREPFRHSRSPNER